MDKSKDFIVENKWGKKNTSRFYSTYNILTLYILTLTCSLDVDIVSCNGNDCSWEWQIEDSMKCWWWQQNDDTIITTHAIKKTRQIVECARL